MRLLFFALIPGLLAAERVDNVLAQMVPDNTVNLMGIRMEQIKSTPLYQKMLAQQKLPQLDEFARESGFDPRRDVRDMLLANNGNDTVLLARGSFHVKTPPTVKKINYHGYVIITRSDPHPQGGFCILDPTLAAAGPLPVLQAALDQYKSGNRNNAAALLSRARSVPETFQLYGISSSTGNFLEKNMPSPGGGLDVGQIFRTMHDVFFEADMRNGLKGMAEGYSTSPQDAKKLGDAMRGMVGMGRLNTPDNKPELLRVWDGIKVEQTDRKVVLNVDVSQDLIDEIVKLAQTPPRK